MQKKTIVFIQNVNFPQQGAIDIFYYAKYLSKYKNIKTICIVSKIEEDISNENLEIIEIGKTNYFEFIKKSYQYIKDINKKGSIDYVYFFAQHPLSVILQFLVKYFLKIKTIYDVVSGPIGKGIVPLIAKLTIKSGVKLSDKYVILDQNLIQKIGLQKNKTHAIIPMGYDNNVFKPKNKTNLFNRQKDEIIFTYIGTLNKERNLNIFIQAFIENVKKHKNIKLYFIGSGTGKRYLQEISKKHKKNIYFLGKKPHYTIPDYINSSDILISYVPKIDYFEYQPPTKLIEYLGCNKPVIATNTIAQEEILKGFEHLIHQDNLLSTQEKIHYYIKNIENLKKGDYKNIVSQYTWDNLVRKIYEIL